MVALATALHRRRRRVRVATFYPEGTLRRELIDAGVPVESLNKRGRWDIASFSLRLVRLVQRSRPDVLHSYLPDANLLAGVLRPVLPRVRLVWGVRASHVELSSYDWASRVSYGAARLLSRQADLIIANSRLGAAYHRMQGYPADRLRVVPNGIDTEIFRPDAAGRDRLRREWQILPATPLVGLVARLDPMKDHRTFMEAATRLAARRPGVRFVCIGSGPSAYERELRERASALGLDRSLLWAGERSDMPAVYSALDVTTSTSIGEGFPNAVAEAMACGTPCVATDVGDSAWIVGDAGEVVPTRDPAAVADAWERVIARAAGRPSPEQRARIVAEFSVERLVTDTERLLWPA
jgi:glycosyltransferase involved in cell wall biosynthesis